jgi:phosphonate transport system substrate-binding protein
VISAPNTTGAYYSVGVVKPKLNPGITSIKDFAGKKTCYSDPASTSGYLAAAPGDDGVGPGRAIDLPAGCQAGR